MPNQIKEGINNNLEEENFALKQQIKITRHEMLNAKDALIEAQAVNTESSRLKQELVDRLHQSDTWQALMIKKYKDLELMYIQSQETSQRIQEKLNIYTSNLRANINDLHSMQGDSFIDDDQYNEQLELNIRSKIANKSRYQFGVFREEIIASTVSTSKQRDVVQRKFVLRKSFSESALSNKSLLQKITCSIRQ